MKRVQIINTSVANIRSLQAAFDRLHTPWQLTERAEQIVSATHVVLPGVGSFAAAADALDRLEIRQAIIDRIELGRPLLCICLGMQLLGESSEESPNARGLAVLPHQIRRFSTAVKVPQLGWNDVRTAAAGPFKTGAAYFANSFRLLEPPTGWGYSETDYDGPFISSIWRDRTLACQFHPELSGAWGQQLLQNWLES